MSDDPNAGEVHEVSIEFDSGFGQGVDESPANPLVRPFRLAVDQGKDLGRVNYVFYREGQQPSRVFGVFCHTRGRRLLFFPGIRGRKFLWHSKAQLARPPEGLIDHFTAEADHESWHVTTLRDGRKEGRASWLQPMRLTRLRRGVHLWFGLSVTDSASLYPTPAKTAIILRGKPGQPPRSDYIVRSRAGAKFHVLSLAEGSEVCSPGFLHFDVILDRSFTRWFRRPPRLSCAPFKHPALLQSVRPESPFWGRLHWIRLRGYPGRVYVNVCRRPGQLSCPCIVSNTAPC